MPYSQLHTPAQFILVHQAQSTKNPVYVYTYMAVYRSNSKYCTAANIVPDLHPQQLVSSEPTNMRKWYNVESCYSSHTFLWRKALSPKVPCTSSGLLELAPFFLQPKR